MASCLEIGQCSCYLWNGASCLHLVYASALHARIWHTQMRNWCCLYRNTQLQRERLRRRHAFCGLVTLQFPGDSKIGAFSGMSKKRQVCVEQQVVFRTVTQGTYVGGPDCVG